MFSVFKDPWMQDRMCYMQIPRPILRMDHFASSLKSGGSLNGRYYPDESTVVVVQQENLRNELISGCSESPNSSTNGTEERTESPTHFTLLGQSGTLKPTGSSARTSVGNRRARCSCSSWQLSFSVCSFILLALVAMIVYMEGIAWLLSNAKI